MRSRESRTQGSIGRTAHIPTSRDMRSGRDCAVAGMPYVARAENPKYRGAAQGVGYCPATSADGIGSQTDSRTRPASTSAFRYALSGRWTWVVMPMGRATKEIVNGASIKISSV